MTAGSPKIFSGSPLIIGAPKCSEKVLEESVTLCGPKDSGEVVWSSGSCCRGYGRALQSSMIRCYGVQSYTSDRCTSRGRKRGTLNPEAWGTVVSDGQLHSSEARASHHLRSYMCYLLQWQEKCPA